MPKPTTPVADQPALIEEPPPQGLEAGTCRSCGARICWGVTAAGRKCPVDAKPATSMILNPEGKLVQVQAWTNHFVTCPSADQHRAEKRDPAGEPGPRQGLEPHPGGR